MNYILPVLIVTGISFVFGIIWSMLGFGIRNKQPRIKDVKIVYKGLAISLIACGASWSTFVFYGIGYACFLLIHLIGWI